MGKTEIIKPLYIIDKGAIFFTRATLRKREKPLVKTTLPIPHPKEDEDLSRWFKDEL